MTDQVESKELNGNKMSDNTQLLSIKRVLVVGAGGIGCELLKNLVMSGFKKITIVDLDKVEKSNLNRQFLFDKDCIGKYKSEMARQSILKHRKDPMLEIEAFVGNIKDKSKFDLDFFKKHDIILNALDNIDARTYINKICIQNDIPLVNSGTEGFLGNAAVHIKGETPCYSCRPKTKQKAIPICSIRSKPEKMEHCVAWAKALFELLFSENTNGNLLEDYTIHDNPSVNFQNYFFYNIKKEHSANVNGNTGTQIEPIDIQKILHYEIDDLESSSNQENYSNFNSKLSTFDHCEKTASDISTLVLILLKSTLKLQHVIKQTGQKFDKFDKENKEIVNFVFSASNLRASNFKIKNQTRFKIKEIAGNIIPAIASTNAIIAAIQTEECLKVLLLKKEQLRNVNFNKEKKIASVKSQNDEKNPKCPVCSQEALKKNCNRIILTINSNEFTLGKLIEVIKEKYSVANPQIYKNNSLIYESGEDLDEDEVEEFEKLKSNTLSTFISETSKEFRIFDLSGKIYFNLVIVNDVSKISEEFDIKGDLSFSEEDNSTEENQEQGESMDVETTSNHDEIEEITVNNGNLEVELVQISEVSRTHLFINQKRGKDEITFEEEGEQNSLKKRRIENQDENITIIN
jgi:ubiquitin-like 1-activating enzyme E1 B